MMKFYTLLTVSPNGDPEKVEMAVFHKHFFVLKEDAFREALKTPNTCVLELTHTDTWSQTRMHLELTKN